LQAQQASINLLAVKSTGSLPNKPAKKYHMPNGKKIRQNRCYIRTYTTEITEMPCSVDHNLEIINSKNNEVS
jgi:hypothetical protein